MSLQTHQAGSPWYNITAQNYTGYEPSCVGNRVTATSGKGTQ